MAKVKKEGQATMFAYAWLEVFTKTNPVVHVLTYGGMMAICMYAYHGDIIQFGWLFILGAITWTFTEYMLHRYVFHIKPSRIQYLIHGVHHEFPRDKERLMMPPLPGTLVALVFYGIFYMLMQQHAPLFMAGFLLGYMAYTFIHYIVHAWKPIPGLKFLWTHHHRHHNPALENTSFGVSSPLWDYVFGTMPKG